MASTNVAYLCGGATDCVAEMSVLKAQVDHWKIATSISLGVLGLVVCGLGIGYLVIFRHPAKFTKNSADDIERTGSRTIVDATCARPFIIAIEDHSKIRTAAHKVDITPRKLNGKLSPVFREG